MFRRIHVLSGISIFGILLTHGISYGLWALYAWTGRYEYMLPANFDPFQTPQWFVLIFTRQLFSFCVPVFFFVSGYFINYAIDRKIGNVRIETIKSRIIDLLYPFIIWTVISLALNMVLGTATKPIDYFLPFFGINGLWFIPAIILFYLLARGIVFLARWNWKLLLISAALVQFLFIVLRYLWFINIQNELVNYILDDNFDILAVNYLFYFPLGIVLGMKSAQFKEGMSRYRIAILVGLILFTIAGLYLSGWTKVYVHFVDNWTNFLEQMVTHFYSLTLILSFLAFENVKVPLVQWFSKLGSKSYGIYLTHYFFMMVFSKLVYHYFPSLLYYQVLFMILNVAIGLGGALSLMALVRRLPTAQGYSYLFG